MKNSLIAGTPYRAMNTTTQLEKVNVIVQKVYGLGNQQPSTVQVKVQRSGDIPHRFQVESKSESPRTGEDMIRSCWKLQE